METTPHGSWPRPHPVPAQGLARWSPCHCSDDPLSVCLSVVSLLFLPSGPGQRGPWCGPESLGSLGTALRAASPARLGFAGTQGLRRPTRSWETRRASRSPSSISVCCRMWRLHSPCAGKARGRSAGGGVSLGHDPTAVGMGTGQVRGCRPPAHGTHPQPAACPHHRVLLPPIQPDLPARFQAADSWTRACKPPHPSTPTFSQGEGLARHSPCKWPSRLSPDRLALSSSRLGRYGGA